MSVGDKFTYELAPFERREEIIGIHIPENKSESDFNLTIETYSESEPEQSDNKEAIISIEEIPEPEVEKTDSTWDWENFDKIFIHWLLPIIILIIVLIGMIVKLM